MIRKLFGGEISPEGQIMFDLVKILVMVGVLVALLVGRCLHDRKRKRVRGQVLGELAKLQEQREAMVQKSQMMEDMVKTNEEKIHLQK